MSPVRQSQEIVQVSPVAPEPKIDVPEEVQPSSSRPSLADFTFSPETDESYPTYIYPGASFSDPYFVIDRYAITFYDGDASREITSSDVESILGFVPVPTECTAYTLPRRMFSSLLSA